MTLIDVADKADKVAFEWATWASEESELIRELQDAGFMLKDPEPKPPCLCCGQERR